MQKSPVCKYHNKCKQDPLMDAKISGWKYDEKKEMFPSPPSISLWDTY